jgi:hypothetical protein
MKPIYGSTKILGKDGRMFSGAEIMQARASVLDIIADRSFDFLRREGESDGDFRARFIVFLQETEAAHE